MAGLVPAIHVFLCCRKAWMPGTRPGMTDQEASAFFSAGRSRQKFVSGGEIQNFAFPTWQVHSA
jgi:hypothetical protein